MKSRPDVKNVLVHKRKPALDKETRHSTFQAWSSTESAPKEERRKKAEDKRDCRSVCAFFDVSVGLLVRLSASLPVWPDPPAPPEDPPPEAPPPPHPPWRRSSPGESRSLHRREENEPARCSRRLRPRASSRLRSSRSIQFRLCFCFCFLAASPTQLLRMTKSIKTRLQNRNAERKRRGSGEGFRPHQHRRSFGMGL